MDDVSIRTRGFNYFLSFALADLALHLALLRYLEKVEPVSKTLCAVRSDAPTSGICLLLEFVFSLRQEYSTRSI